MESFTRSEQAILVAEDDPAVCGLLTEVLQSWGFKVRHAHSLDTAVRAVFLWGPFEAVVCDQSLRDGSALVFRNWLREQGITIPFLLITGPDDGSGLRSSARFEFLSRPFPLGELRAALERLLPQRMLPAEGVEAGDPSGWGMAAVGGR